MNEFFFGRISPPAQRFSAISLDNQLVVLATTAADAGRYHVEAVNELTGENATSAAVYLSVSVNGSSEPSEPETSEPESRRSA
ncbi:unnamed protein product [Boreogadus saida]